MRAIFRSRLSSCRCGSDLQIAIEVSIPNPKAIAIWRSLLRRKQSRSGDRSYTPKLAIWRSPLHPENRDLKIAPTPKAIAILILFAGAISRSRPRLEASRLRAGVRMALAPKGRSNNAPAMTVEGSGTGLGARSG